MTRMVYCVYITKYVICGVVQGALENHPQNVMYKPAAK